MRATIDWYACPECGFDGPHAIQGVQWPPTVECGNTECAIEFVADPGLSDHEADALNAELALASINDYTHETEQDRT